MGSHLRVDLADRSDKEPNRNCSIFIGNLPFGKCHPLVHCPVVLRVLRIFSLHMFQLFYSATRAVLGLVGSVGVM